MIDLDRKLLDTFQGYVVRKDIVRSVKGQDNRPPQRSQDQNEQQNEHYDNDKTPYCFSSHHPTSSSSSRNPVSFTLIMVKKKTSAKRIMDPALEMPWLGTSKLN